MFQELSKDTMLEKIILYVVAFLRPLNPFDLTKDQASFLVNLKLELAYLSFGKSGEDDWND